MMLLSSIGSDPNDILQLAFPELLSFSSHLESRARPSEYLDQSSLALITLHTTKWLPKTA